MEPATPANPNGAETILESFTYAYNNATGNITRITTANGEYTDYTYDLLDRLTCEEKKTQAGHRIYKIEYLFDNNDAKNGNIHRIVVNDTDVTEFTYNPMNQLTGITHPDSSTETLTYDDNGNLTQSVNNTTGETTTYTWDCNNRMTGVVLSNGEILEFGYQGDKMIIKEKSDGREKTITNSGLYGIRETIKVGGKAAKRSVAHTVLSNPSSMGDLSGQILSSRMFSPEGVYGSDSGDIYYHPDHLGSVRLITDENGNIKDRLQTDAYGNTLPLETAQSNKPAKTLQPFNFIGSYGIRYLHKIKMYNMRARWQNSQTNRFISTDEIFSTNRYNYVAGNPVMMVDPTGMHEIVAGGNSLISHMHDTDSPTNKLVPFRLLFGWDKKERYMDLHRYFLGINTNDLNYKLNAQELREFEELYQQAIGIAIGRAMTRMTESSSFPISLIRNYFTQNCVGLAFGGQAGVKIEQVLSYPIIKNHYNPLPSTIKEKDMKRGDIIIWHMGENNNYSHVATVAFVGKRKNCYKALLHERDGDYGEYATLFEDGNKFWGEPFSAYRPQSNVTYKSKGKQPLIIFPYSAFLYNYVYYKGILKGWFGFNAE